MSLHTYAHMCVHICAKKRVFISSHFHSGNNILVYICKWTPCLSWIQPSKKLPVRQFFIEMYRTLEFQKFVRFEKRTCHVKNIILLHLFFSIGQKYSAYFQTLFEQNKNIHYFIRRHSMSEKLTQVKVLHFYLYLLMYLYKISIKNLPEII